MSTETRSRTPALATIRSRVLDCVPVVVLAALATLILFRHGIGHLRSHVFGTPGDAELFIWSFRWIPWSISHGVYPLTSHAVFSTSGGINLAHNTFAPLGALVLWPITSLYGPVLSYNLYAISAPILDALAGYIVLRPHLRRTPATIGALMFAFSPLNYTASVGHPQVNHLWAATIGLALILRAINSDDSKRRRRMAIIGGLLLALQLYMGIEMLALAVVVLVLSVGCMCIVDADYRSNLVERARDIVRPLALAIGTFVLIGAPFLATYVLGPQKYFGIQQFQDTSSADLANFIVPTGTTFFNGPTFVSKPSTQPFLTYERGAYLGILLLAVLIYLTVRKWKEMSTFFRLALTFFWVGSVLSLGSQLEVWGKNTQITLPWAIFAKTPVMRSALPMRIPILTSLAAGAALGWLLERWRSHSIPGAWKAVAVIGLVMIIPGETPGAFPVPTTTAAQAITRFCGQDAQVVAVPRLYQHHAMLLQAQADNTFDLVRAFGFRQSTAEFGNVLAIDQESGVQPNRAGIAQARAELRQLGTTCVIAMDSSLATWTSQPDRTRLAAFFGRPCTPIGLQCGWNLRRIRGWT